MSPRDATDEPTYFESAAKFRAWLKRNASTRTELVVGYHKVGSGTTSMTWPESVDEALCVGWVDGVRKRIDDARYQIRFTPRKKTSIWSAVNIARVAVLTAEGRMQQAGLDAFAHRVEHKSKTYAYEQKDTASLSADEEKLFRKNKPAWDYFSKQAPSYRKRLLWWIVSAKQPETRARRVQQLIEASTKGVRL
jgi:uncharacterized protein YdeI (YjbR/CyaY-like superfamily)